MLIITQPEGFELDGTGVLRVMMETETPDAVEFPTLDLRLGDCLDVMQSIPSGSVDLILTDPPYGTVKGLGLDGWDGKKTDWDLVIDPEAMFAECNRILRKNGALLLFCQDPFTGQLMTNFHPNVPFAYRLTWLKDHFANSLFAKEAPVNYTEDILAFFKKYDTENYHPLRDYSMRVMKFLNYSRSDINKYLNHLRADHFFRPETMQFGICTAETYSEIVEAFGLSEHDWFLDYSEMEAIDGRFKRQFKRQFNLQEGTKYKSNVLTYKKDYTGHHPTQKPVALIDDLIRTYSLEGDTVLDFTMGSGTTGIAAFNSGRDFIGIEKDPDIFETAQWRIKAETAQLSLF